MYEIWACAKKGGGSRWWNLIEWRVWNWGKVGLVCVCGGWSTPEAPYSAHADHVGCHGGWWMWVEGQVGRAWPRAQALTVTRSDTPSPPALTATSGRRHSSKYGRRHYNYNQNLCSSGAQSQRSETWTNVVLSAPTRRQAAAVFTQQVVPFTTKSYRSILNCSSHPLGSSMLIRRNSLMELTRRDEFGWSHHRGSAAAIHHQSADTLSLFWSHCIAASHSWNLSGGIPQGFCRALDKEISLICCIANLHGGTSDDARKVTL